MKKRKILILLVVIILLLFRKEKAPINRANQVYNLEYTEEAVFNCVDTSDLDCLISNKALKRIYHYKEDNEDIASLVSSYNASIYSKMESEGHDSVKNYAECADVQDKYLYRYLTTNNVIYYEDTDKDIISMVFDIVTTDYCLGTETRQFDVYSYSKSLQEFIYNEDDEFEKYGFSKNQINDIIVHYAKKYLNMEVDPQKITNYRLLYNFAGQLVIDFQYEGKDEWIEAAYRD